MIQNINIEARKLNKLMKTLGMNKIDVERILQEKSTKEEQLNFSLGPRDPPYWGGYYGSISIKDF